MNILEFHSHVQDGGVMKISLHSSYDLFESECSVGAEMSNGSSGFLNWNIEMDSHSPIVVKAESVLKVKDRMLLKTKDIIGNTMVFNGEVFHSVGKSSNYLVLDRCIDGLNTGSDIEVFGAAYKYTLNIIGITIDDIKTLVFSSYKKDGSIEKRSYIFKNDSERVI